MPATPNLKRNLSAGDLNNPLNSTSTLELPRSAFSRSSACLTGLALTARQSVTGALGQLRSMLINNQKYSIGRANDQAKQLMQRQAQLNLPPGNQLFHFEKVELPNSLMFDDAPVFLLPKPLDAGKQLLSDQYREKYGIHIEPLSSENAGVREFTEQMIRSVMNHAPEPVGFVVPVVSAKGAYSTLNYRGHVLALAAHKTDYGLEVFNLDSLAQDSQFTLDLIQNLREVAQCHHLGLVESFLVDEPRQADKHSCHTDAYQILKDLLVVFKRGKLSCLKELLLTTGAGKVRHAMSGKRFVLPSTFHKTSQLSSAVKQASPHHESVLNHRQKYTAAFEYGGTFLQKSSNHFLSIKALHNADKVIAKLERLPVAERQEYLKATGLSSSFTQSK